LLNENGIAHHYREYTQDPLSRAELVEVLDLLGSGPKDVIRRNDKAYKELGLASVIATMTDDALIDTMVKHPTLLQRPIGVIEGRAVIGRPPEALLTL